MLEEKYPHFIEKVEKKNAHFSRHFLGASWGLQQICAVI
jgi:hypothetical protein